MVSVQSFVDLELSPRPGLPSSRGGCLEVARAYDNARRVYNHMAAGTRVTEAMSQPTDKVADSTGDDVFRRRVNRGLRWGKHEIAPRCRIYSLFRSQVG